MWTWRSARRAPTDGARIWTRRLTSEGVVIDVGVGEGEVVNDQGWPDLAAQLEDEGYLTREPDGRCLVTWDALYRLLAHAEYAPALAGLDLPPVIPLLPCLTSRGALTDADFRIAIAGWVDGEGQPVSTARSIGACLETARGPFLLPQPAWILKKLIVAFANRSVAERDERAQRQAWGTIRAAALAAGARLDDFLTRTVVLTPERLRLEPRRVAIGGTNVVEIVPGFADCPPAWLDHFDRRANVSDRYDIATETGIVQVLIMPAVKTVLSEIKRMPGRRVAGARAEAFLRNPFAALGEDAISVIDEHDFEKSLNDSGLVFERFAAHVRRDESGYPVEVGLRVEAISDAAAPAEGQVVLFQDDEELARFITTVRRKLAEGFQLCPWRDLEFEFDGETPRHLETLQRVLDERRTPPPLISYARVHDLSGYSDRIEGIGEEPPFFSPYIAKKDYQKPWVPENITPVIVWRPDEGETVALEATDALRMTLAEKVKAARDQGLDHVTLPECPRPIPAGEAENLLDVFKKALDEASKGGFEPRSKESRAPIPKARLILKPNVEAVDYEERGRETPCQVEGYRARTPRALRPETKLKAHQFEGLAWLQALFEKSPRHCRGAVLADDMGLGKTLQLLAFIAAAFEEDPQLDPALVVAPVSLLENWEEEIERFFRPGSLRILTAYGDGLKKLRVPKARVDQELRGEGLVNFLKPGWRGSARLVLTTYETLRDLEFSFAAERWSIMVCDEAQRIKTPSALVTRAAKKQNVRFKIACTGTPVENTLADLWCLFDFVQPGLLGALNEFGRRYRKPIEAETDEEKARVDELREKIAPRLLRRVKADVAQDLPPKLADEDCRALPLSPFQRLRYVDATRRFHEKSERADASRKRGSFDVLHELRMICTDPGGRRPDDNNFEPLSLYRRDAPKLDWLLKTLAIIRDRGEKAIIFCEYRTTQRLLRHYVQEVFGLAPDIINGDTAAAKDVSDSRQKRIKAFQETPGFNVLVLSPVAVGFGVNIQAANHVIHYMRTWNPAKEDQATDRAHRIGQTKAVHVYCPTVVAQDFLTFDAKLDDLLERKRALAQDMLNGAGDVGENEFAIEDIAPTVI